MARSRTPKKKSSTNSTRYRWLGAILIVFTLFPFLSLLTYDSGDVFWLQSPPNTPPNNLIGVVGAVGAAVAYRFFGFGAWLLPPLLLAFSIRLAAGRNKRPWLHVGWLALLLVTGCALLQLANEPLTAPMERLRIRPDAGGMVGWLLMSRALIPLINPLGSGLVMAALFLTALTLAIGPRNIADGFQALLTWRRRWALARADQARRLELEEKALARQLAKEAKLAEREARRLEKEQLRAEREAGREAKRREREERDAAKVAAQEEQERLYEERKAELQREREAEAQRQEEQRRAAERARAAAADEEGEEVDSLETASDDVPEPPTAPYELPSVELLSPLPQGSAVYGDVEQKAATIVRTLSEFNIEVDVTHIVKGPVVTSFELLPAPGIRVERIASMSKNLEMALKATSVRVEAPIPGKGVVGIETPNEKASPVTVREILEAPRWAECCRDMELPALLGKNVSGQDLVIDLTSMPHLLVAGATNSGKSVCINAILTGLLMSRTPDQLRLMLIDPKIVEFAPYNELPHLVVPVITDPKKVALGLRWAIQEMEKRYKLLNLAGVRNISAYNRRESAVQQELFGEAAPAAGGKGADLPGRLPYILIVIDELADLMLQAGPEIENGIARLAQLSRAVGIHLLIATQRPSVNVITGTIKANFPGRIAFQVAQKVDSRTILDGMGAETLIGRGDMLFLNPRTSKMVRAQGAYIGDEDAKRVVDFIRSQSRPIYLKEVQEQLDGAAGGDEGGAAAGPAGFAGAAEAEDELYEPAVDLIRRTKRASTSSLQRAFRIGYTRAARLMDIMEERGIVGPPRGSDPREILIDFDGEIPDNSPSTAEQEESLPDDSA